MPHSFIDLRTTTSKYSFISLWVKSFVVLNMSDVNTLIVEPFKTFVRDSIYLVKKCTKPDRQGKISNNLVIYSLSNHHILSTEYYYYYLNNYYIFFGLLLLINIITLF